MSAALQSNTASVAQLAHRERRKEPLRACVQTALELYFRDLDGHHFDPLVLGWQSFGARCRRIMAIAALVVFRAGNRLGHRLIAAWKRPFDFWLGC